ncbi:transcription factor IBH1-like 1 [Impatiens glandulifera]|uniref:transcription factor IBH1-like 1 n=1 Tax=Impatiens glandulifera TaxID=253017 RepID=UPI001FB12570|nr:transcription factor IBH1-like 1 [Impatiens glandulifera]
MVVSTSLLKQEFLKKWTTGMNACASSINNKSSSFLERKEAIKFSADVAMASTRMTNTRWRRALIANASQDPENKLILDKILVSKSNNIVKTKMSTSGQFHRSRIISKKGKYRKKEGLSRRRRRLVNKTKVVSKRIQMLRKLVPGGEDMGESSLMKEALDYIISLQTQVDGMKLILTNAIGTKSSLNHK